MKQHHSLYLFGAFFLIMDMSLAYGDATTYIARTSTVSDGMMGIVILFCGFLFSRQHQEIARLKSIIERLRGPEVDLYSEAKLEIQTEAKTNEHQNEK